MKHHQQTICSIIIIVKRTVQIRTVQIITRYCCTLSGYWNTWNTFYEHNLQFSSNLNDSLKLFWISKLIVAKGQELHNVCTFNTL